MANFRNKVPHSWLLLFLMTFAIIFVSIFTYLSLYSNTIEQMQKQLGEDIQFQSTMLRQVFQPVADSKNPSSESTAMQAAINETKNFWAEMPKDNTEVTYYLTYKTPETGRIEILHTSNKNKLHEKHQYLIAASVYIGARGYEEITINNLDNKEIILATYATIIPGKLGLVIQQRQHVAASYITESINYTLFAALLIILISLLVFRLRLRAISNKANSSEERFQQLLENSEDWLWEIDNESIITYSSDQAFGILGYNPEELQQRPFTALFDLKETNNDHLVWKQKIMFHDSFHNLEVNFKHKNGKTVFLLLSGHPILDNKQVTIGYRGTARDISEIKKREDKIINLAFYDPLTQLCNRQHFIDKLSKYLATIQSHQDTKPSALLFIDLDGFKEINDSEGHEFGDKLLQVIALRLQSNARKTDVVARLGGDEFVILLSPNNTHDLGQYVKHIEEYLSRLLEMINKSVHIEQTVLHVQASIGVALIPKDGKTVSSVLSCADTAMYQAKLQGKNTYQFYDHNTQKKIEQKLKTSNELTHAIENNELELFYQFQYQEEKIIGMEALLRWQHPETRKIMSAMEFLDSVLETHHIQLIDEWVINKVAQDIHKMNQNLATTPKVSINLSTRELEANNLIEHIESALKKNFLSGHSLNIEINENSLTHDPEKSISAIKKLQKLGVTTCIDHFGTGNSNLSYLQALPIDAIKIDKSFIDNIATSRSDLQMCRTIIQLGKSLEFNVIAEGVESTTQKEILKGESCQNMQGYLFSQPIPLTKVIQYLQDKPDKVSTL